MGPILVMPMLKAVKNGVKINDFKKFKLCQTFWKMERCQVGVFYFLKCPRGSSTQ
jgi:hypothetical protein